MAVVQSTLIFYACSRGFGTSITLLDGSRLNQIQPVSWSSFRRLSQQLSSLVNRGKRHLRVDNYLPVQVLRGRYILAPHAAENTQ